MTRHKQNCGQAYVITVLFLAVLLALAAAVLDIGSWYRADRSLQATVDAAALAGAQALPNNTANASALAAQYATKNGGGTMQVTFSTKYVANDTIKVSGSKPAPGFFSKVIGVNGVTVHATASARVAAPSDAWGAAPIVVDESHPYLHCNPNPCTGATDLDLDKTGPGNFKLVNLDNDKGGTGPPILADWIQNGLNGFMDLGWYYGDPGAKFNSSQVKGALDARIGSVLLFPVYRAVQGNGSNLQYEIVGWVGFYLTGYDIQGSKNNKLYGHFTEVIWKGIVSESGSGSSDFGVHSVSLVD
jgi:hypothetical protein